MQKIANAREFQAALQELLALSSKSHPSRETLASELVRLASRVAGRQIRASVTPLNGHDSPDMAYVVDDYPYGFRLRTKIRYWLESVPKKGTRFVSQTLNPKTDRWNAPKKSTFNLLGGVMFLDSKGHVQFDALNEYSDANKVEEFLEKYPHAHIPVLKLWAEAKFKLFWWGSEGHLRRGGSLRRPISGGGERSSATCFAHVFAMRRSTARSWSSPLRSRSSVAMQRSPLLRSSSRVETRWRAHCLIRRKGECTTRANSAIS